MSLVRLFILSGNFSRLKQSFICIYLCTSPFISNKRSFCLITLRFKALGYFVQIAPKLTQHDVVNYYSIRYLYMKYCNFKYYFQVNFTELLKTHQLCTTCNDIEYVSKYVCVSLCRFKYCVCLYCVFFNYYCYCLFCWSQTGNATPACWVSSSRSQPRPRALQRPRTRQPPWQWLPQSLGQKNLPLHLHTCSGGMLRALWASLYLSCASCIPGNIVNVV